ncbi:MAG: dethiobiotin synthase [Candidatus Omnitrophota bacterium]|nr:MAG: dethiobiotin synthase [Candidatus Omnitrophota bacterium]
MKAVFITGTDTGVGKTTVTGLLGRFLLDNGHRAVTQKWIQTGSNKFPKDIARQPYTFKFPASPHLAARLERKRINKTRIKKSFLFLKDRFDFIIIEGIGGALVPFNGKDLVIDIAKELDIPALLVVANKLGCINHTLLTIEAMKRRNMKIIGIIFNQLGKKENIISKDNPRIIKKLTGERVLGILPFSKSKELLYKRFIPIGEKIAGWQ